VVENSDNTKQLLEKMLADLYSQAAGEGAKEAQIGSKSYLIAGDEQFLGKITNNLFDQDSILNQYGPYGSVYSPTSIWNQYSQYGGVYGRFSPQNPYCNQPPKLFINGNLIGVVSDNQFLSNRIPFESFQYTLRNDIQSLLRGKIVRDEVEARIIEGDTFVRAADGTFLGSLNPNRYDTNSLFNRYGTYGNRYNQLSIFNRYSPYGGSYSEQSPYNPRARRPPEIWSGNKKIAHLTVNTAFKPRVDPNEVLDWAERNVKKRYV
jgi:hypothetical protein